MDIASKIAFYSALGLGTPIIVLSYRCISILTKQEYRKHAFCRIFICSLLSNSLAFILLMHNLRFPGMGFFPGYYELMKDAWWQPLHYHTIWRHFFYLHLPFLLVFSGLLNLEALLNRAEYVQARDSSGGIFYMFVNYNLTLNLDSYWMIVECTLDLLCNILIILKFANLRMGQMKRTPFENSLYFISFSSFIVHTATTAMQIFDAALLLPTVAILALTKEIRTEVRRALFSCGRFVSSNMEKLGLSRSK